MNDMETLRRWQGAWRMHGDVVQGRVHAEKDMPCQDRVYCLQAGDVYAIALADGAGSAAHSEVGAELTTRTACEYLAGHIQEIIAAPGAGQVKTGIHGAILEVLKARAEAEQWELNSLASTLLFVAVKGEDCLIGHIGDGVICCQNGTQVKAISLPSNGEYSNTTTFVTSRNALADFRLYKTRLGQLRAFCLMSDGAAESMFNRRTHEVAVMVGKVFSATVNLTPARSAAYYRRLLSELLRLHTSDDCSIAVMARANTAQALLSLSRPDFMALLGLRNARSARAMYALLDELSAAPQTRSVLARRLHTREKAVARRLAILMERDIVTRRNGLYYVR